MKIKHLPSALLFALFLLTVTSLEARANAHKGAVMQTQHAPLKILDMARQKRSAKTSIGKRLRARGFSESDVNEAIAFAHDQLDAGRSLFLTIHEAITTAADNTYTGPFAA